MERKILQNQAVSILNETLHAEMSGDYSRGYQLLSVFWNDFRVKPNTAELSEDIVAEIFLRCGSISGYLGRSGKISEAQEISRTLLFDAKQKFFQIRMEAKEAECDNYISLTYERIGDIKTAREFLENAFDKNISISHPVRLFSHIIDSLLNLTEKNHEIIINNSLMLESLFQNCPNKNFQGCFYNHYGLALKHLGKTNEAMDKFLSARHLFFEIGHHQYCGALENNIAHLYLYMLQYKEAHNFAKKAENTFKLVGDFCRQGYSLDTQACIYLSEGEYEKAMDCADKALKLLQNGENKLFLLNTYKTKINILLRLKNPSEAVETFQKAKTIAEQIDESTLEKFVTEMKSLFVDESVQISG